MEKYYVKDCPNNKEMLQYIESLGGFLNPNENYLGNFKFNEFTLDELTLPSYDKILQGIKNIENVAGLKGWSKKTGASREYKGFSLTYNQDFYNKETSVFHQTFGDNNVSDPHSRTKNGLDDFDTTKNTYYDTYGFRHIHSVVHDNLKDVFDKINGAVLRSRVGYFYSSVIPYPNKMGWHIDEMQHTMLRLVIPVKTTDNYFLEIDGSDDYGNTEKAEYTLELGKAYIWNNRIPHRVTARKKTYKDDPRIHVIVGFSPWFNYSKEEDCFYPNDNHGMTIEEIINEKRFIK